LRDTRRSDCFTACAAVATFDDGQALFHAVCERGLEGVVAKRERDNDRLPGARDW
jgi:ATP-dependent DNA ligase